MDELEFALGFPLLQRVIREGYRNPSLVRADEMRAFLITVLTNKDWQTLVPQFKRRQTDDQYTQQNAITNASLSAIGKRLFRRFVKASRVSGIYKRIEVDGNEANALRLVAKCENFYARKPIEDFLFKNVNMYSLIDANGFYAVHFKPFNPGDEPVIYPVIWPCTQVVEFLYDEVGVLKKLLVKMPVTYVDKQGVSQVVTDYLLYEPGWQTQFREVRDGRDFPAGTSFIEFPTGVTVNQQNLTSISLSTDTKVKYGYFRSDTRTDEIPAQRLGYEVDAEDMTLCVSPIYAAQPHFKDYMRLKSNLDLTTLLHVFARLFQYVEKCPGEGSGKSCAKGVVVPSSPARECKKCKGKGVITQDNAMDVLYMPIPDDIKDMVPLDKLAYYLTPDIKVVDKLQEMLYELEYQKIPITVFGTEILIRANGSKVVDATATENLLSADQVNDTLQPFTGNVEDQFNFTVRQIAAFNDIKKATSAYTYPADLAVESTAELLGQMKLASESGGNSQMIDMLSDKTMRVLLRDKPNELQRYSVQKRFSPLNGRTDAERQFLIGSNLIPKRIKVLYALFDTIMDEIEEEQRAAKKDFYAMNYVEQNTLVDSKITKYLAELDAEAPIPALNFNDPTNPQPPVPVNP